MPWPGKTENVLESKRQKRKEKKWGTNSNMAAGGGFGVELFKTCAMIDYAQTDV